MSHKRTGISINKAVRKPSKEITYFSKNQRECIERFVSSVGSNSREMVESKCGAPIKVTIDWVKKQVIFSGSKMAWALKMSDILTGQK